MPRPLTLNPDKGGSYYKDSQGRFHLYDTATGQCLDGYTEDEAHTYPASTYEEMEELVKANSGQ